MARFEVRGPLVVIKDNLGQQRHIYGPATIDSDTFPTEELDRLTERELLVKVDDDEPATGRVSANSRHASDDEDGESKPTMSRRRS